jgi:hypothetical protein
VLLLFFIEVFELAIDLIDLFVSNARRSSMSYKFSSSKFSIENVPCFDSVLLISSFWFWRSSSFFFSTISSMVYNDLAQIPVNQQVYANDISTFNNISAQIVNYEISDELFRSNIVSSYNNISSLLGPSTFVMIQTGNLLSTIKYYRGMDAVTAYTISSLKTDISGIYYQISDLTASNEVVLNSMQGEILSVKTTGGEFYTLYGQGLDAECDEYLYAIKELNSQIGYITACLGIARNANAVQIDEYIFTILSNPNDTATIGYKDTLVAHNIKISNIIQTINSLDLQFNSIMTYIGTEKTQRKNFIEKRQTILIDFEAPALGWTPIQIANSRVNYFAAFADLNITINTVNDCVRERGIILQGIQTTLNNPLPGTTGDSVHNLINTYFQLYLGSNGADQLPDNLLMVKDDDGALLGGSFIIKEYNPPNTVLTVTGVDYAFIPPIVF